MTITVRFFAIVRELAGAAEAALELPDDATITTARHALALRFPPLRDHLSRAAFAVNRNYASPQQVLRDGDELAVIPPVSGG